jgi:putative zinc finger/helix-turn-helix YgiT family protein
MRRCEECGGALAIERNAVRRYELGGLPHVELHGVEVARCTKCGLEEVSIPRIQQLHKLLAEHLISLPRSLAPVEVKFLRKHIGLSTIDFARCMGVSRETVSRWETGNKPMGSASDRLLRLLVATSTPISDYSATDVLKELDSSRPAPKRPARFGMRASQDGWRPEKDLVAA